MEDGKVRVLILGDSMATGMLPLADALFHKKFFRILLDKMDKNGPLSGCGLAEITGGVWDGYIQEIGSGHTDGNGSSVRIQCPLRNPDYEFTIASFAFMDCNWMDYACREWDAIVVTVNHVLLLENKKARILEKFCGQKDIKSLFFVIDCPQSLKGMGNKESGVLAFQLKPILSDENGKIDRDLLRKHICCVDSCCDVRKLRTLSSPSEAQQNEEKAQEDFGRDNEMDFPQFEALYACLEQALHEKKKRNREKSAVFDFKPDAFDKNFRKSLASEEAMEDGKVRVLVAGEIVTGKSSLLNALFRKKVLKTKALPSKYLTIKVTDGDWDGRIQETGNYEIIGSEGSIGETRCFLRNPNYEFIERIILPQEVRLGRWVIPVEWDVAVVTLSLVKLEIDYVLKYIKTFFKQTELENLFFILNFSDIMLEGNSEDIAGDMEEILDIIEPRLASALSDGNDGFDRNLLRRHIFFVNSRAAMESRTISSPSEAREYEEKAKEDFLHYNEMEFPQFEEALYDRLIQVLEKKREKAAKNAGSGSEP